MKRYKPIMKEEANMSIMTAPVDWLHELAKGSIKTQWGQMMAAENPADEGDKVYARLKEQGVPRMVAAMFQSLAPLLAERLAIAEYALENPQIRAVAPEVNSYQEVLELALKENRFLTADELEQILQLLKTDETMQPIA